MFPNDYRTWQLVTLLPEGCHGRRHCFALLTTVFGKSLVQHRSALLPATGSDECSHVATCTNRRPQAVVSCSNGIDMWQTKGWSNRLPSFCLPFSTLSVDSLPDG